MESVVAVGLWGLGVLWVAPWLVTLRVLYRFGPPERWSWWEHLYCRGQVALTGNRWRAVVHPDVDPAKAYLFVQNHVGLLDHVFLTPATPHLKQGIELREHFKIPFYGPFMRDRGTIPVDRGVAGQWDRLRESVAAEVGKGRSILVFPEGTRTPDGKVGPFRTGLFAVARDLGLPVVPVAVRGAYGVQHKGDWRLRAGHSVEVHVLAPRETAGLDEAGVVALAEDCRREIAAVVEAP